MRTMSTLDAPLAHLPALLDVFDPTGEPLRRPVCIGHRASDRHEAT